MRADVELGGSDQLFNLLVGRQLMKNEGPACRRLSSPAPILEGTDARFEGSVVGDKMSKSLGNYVGIDEKPDVQFQKLMPIQDEVLWKYMDLLLEPLDGRHREAEGGRRGGDGAPERGEGAVRARDCDALPRRGGGEGGGGDTQTVRVSLEGAASLPIP